MTSVVIRPSWPIIQEHTEIRRLAARIDAMLAHTPDPGHRMPWLSEMTSRLLELRPRLEAHFAAEEDAGLFEEIAGASPGDAEPARRLMDEHPTLFGSLEDLIELAAASRDDDGTFHTICDRAASLLRELARHEEAENELIFKSLDGGPAAAD